MANYSNLKAAVQDVIKTNGNNEITGAILQSTLLSLINSIGDDYLFAGLATQSTNPGSPDQNVFYLGGAGTYANFGTSITVPDGCICAFKYNGSWTKEIIEVGSGAYDVSKANAAGGVYARYSTLSDALNAIPLSFRKGGMTIQYIDEDAGEYVQYRLMETSWSTNIKDWQGVDDEPIIGSNNLVTSGGVQKNHNTYNTYFEGNNMTLSRTHIYGLIQGLVYRIRLNTISWPGEVTSGYARFIIGYYGSGSYHDIIVVSEGYPILPYYDIEMPSDAEYLFVGGRAELNTKVGFTLEEITDIDRIALGKSSVKLLPSALGIPNINTINNTLEFPNDTILIVGSKSYVLPQTSISFKNGIASSATKVAFNIKTNSFNVYQYNYNISDDDFIVGVFRTTYGTTGPFIDANLPFNYTIDNVVKKKGLQIILNENSDEVVSCKAVSEQLFNNLLVGKGNTASTKIIKGFIPNRKYKFLLPKTSWDMTGITIGSGYGLFWIKSFKNGIETLLVNVTIGEAVTKPYYIIETPSDFDYLLIGGRAALNAIVRFMIEDIGEIIPYADYPYNYIGFPINIVANKWLPEIFSKMQNAIPFQSMVAYGQNIVFFRPDVDNGSPKADIYNIKTGELLENVSVPYGTLSAFHCNTATLGAVINSNNSIMPLIYLSQWNNEKACLVLDLKLENNEYSFDLIQIISASVDSDIIGLGPRDFVVDIDNNSILSVGYGLDTDQALAGNSLKIVTFDLPNLSSGNVTLNNSDVIDNFSLDIIEFTQDKCINDGRLIMSSGIPEHTQECSIYCIDLIKKRVITRVPLSQFYNGEPEGLTTFEDKLLFTFGTNEKVYSLNMI